MDRRIVAAAIAIALIAGLVIRNLPDVDNLKVGDHSPSVAKSIRLYWFIPDGFRADPHVFKVFEWASNGELPNIKKMMDRGSYGYSVPVFPGHTPTNFATLLTGATPKVHGVADGPMRISGYPLNVVSKSGFSSVAKKVPPIWFTLEKAGDVVTLLSVPGSTPPELSRGITIRGRWGGWGLDFPAINFHTNTDTDIRASLGHRNRLFELGSELTKFVSVAKPADWQIALPQSFSPAREVLLSNWGASMFGLIYDSTDDSVENYDSVLFSPDKNNVWTRVRVGEWSDWTPLTVQYQTNNDYKITSPKKMDWERELATIDVKTQARVKVIKLGEKDFFRIRFLYDNMNQYVTKPAHIASSMGESIGPMVDFADNFPPQLIYYDEDKSTFLEESAMSIKWHKEAAGYLIEETGSDVIIHDVYTPNQMLTSRWWLGYLDPKSTRYNEITEEERQKLWQEVKILYKGIDAIIGEILERVDGDAYVILSSDHGIVPLNTEVRLNNIFAKEGLLKYSYDESTGIYKINWRDSKVVFLKMDNIYINPAGLGGNYRRASGPKYEQLRNDVITILEDLRDESGVEPLARVTKWEDAESVGLPPDRVGDLIIANNVGYGWVEDISQNLESFVASITSGYKQAVLPDDQSGMWTPFIVMGPGIKSNYEIETPIQHVDQYPTIMSLLGREIPEFVEGHVLKEIMN
ncbi:MAG: alkaline phosphatase family protein [Gammaproteobacteria bacterium]|nr:alkaline phosphatase family protein [Gammaproteobacteria bacterium]MDH3464349.1 alkaline phosphatase family protein [Gammaproteobacteria bacterium]